MVILKILETSLDLIKLTGNAGVLWNVVPLAIATIAIIAYFERYKKEEPGWNTYFSNTLVLLFVSIALLKYIYEIDSEGIINFIDYPAKSIAIVIVFCWGLFISNLNFSHLLPERYAKYISSPLAINLIAYAVILFVYSSEKLSWIVFASLALIIILLTAFFNLIKIPLDRFFIYVKKEREKEEIQSIKEERFQLDELKRKLKEKNRIIKQVELKELEKKKNQAIKAKRVLKEILRGR